MNVNASDSRRAHEHARRGLKVNDERQKCNGEYKRLIVVQVEQACRAIADATRALACRAKDHSHLTQL
jgi:hypothetical protein